MANAPIIQYYSLDAGDNEAGSPATQAAFVSATGGAVKAGTESAVYKLRIYNDKGDLNNVATAQQVDITIVGTNSLVTDMWCLAKLDTDPTFPLSGIGGATVKTLPDIAQGGNVTTHLKMVVPSIAPATTYNFQVRVSYSYTG
jgi:hypothetical protein